jgi:uncharacterized protein YjbI with pentapeptide repeats/lipoprotein-anchoring transpeptidase ErfK/SrfK
MGPRNGGPINLRGASLQDALLRFASLTTADLEAADMSGADLTHARLDKAKLTAANLSNSCLDFADFAGANLTRLNLRGASLRFARLSSADLAASDMSGANLMHARLNQANLCAANLSHACLDYADFAGADLTKVNLCGSSLQNAKNLTPSQLKESIGSDSTILPPHLQGSVPWSRARSQAAESAALDCRDLRPRTRPMADGSASRVHSFSRPVWLVVVLLIGGTLVAAEFWQPMSLAPSSPKEGLDQSFSERKPDVKVSHWGLRSSPLDTVSEEKLAEILTSAVRAVDRIEVVVRLQRSAPDALIEQTVGVELQPLASAALPPFPARDARAEIAEQHPALAEVRQIAAPEANVHAELRASDKPTLGPNEHAPTISKSRDTLEVSSRASLGSPVFTSRPVAAPSASNIAVISNPLANIESPAKTLVGHALEPFPASLLNATLRPPVLVSLPPSAARRDVLTALAPSVEISLTSVKEQARPRQAKGRNSTDLADSEPTMLSVSLSHQTIDVYRGTALLTSSKVSSGMPGHATKAGVFSILEKQTFHHSNIYSGAPMPWMQRLTRSGTALHGGVVPGYPASHGCIRLPFSFAPKLFQMTTVGENVIVTNDRLAPKLIEHPNLFQPLPTPVSLAMPRGARIPQRRSRDASELAAKDTALPVILAEEGGITIDVSPTSELVASNGPELAPGTAKRGDDGDDAPLRILVTRQTQRDQMIGVQNVLAAMGYLTPRNFDGTFGKATIGAIEAFQKANGLPANGAFTDDLEKRVYKVAGKAEPPAGHLFVRQGFRRVFDEPIAFRQPDQPLGTHIYIALKFVPGDTTTRWMAISLEGGAAASALDRIEFPVDVRQTISERLTAGSSLIIADTSVDSAVLPEGDDFLVWAKDTPAESQPPKSKHYPHAKAKQIARSRPHAEPAPSEANYRSPPRFGRPRFFSRR